MTNEPERPLPSIRVGVAPSASVLCALCGRPNSQDDLVVQGDTPRDR
jgi:hypothetical protein